MRMQWIPGLPSPSPLRRPGDEASLTPTVLRSPTAGKRERRHFSKHSAKYCLIDL